MGKHLRDYRYEAFGSSIWKTDFRSRIKNSTVYQYNEDGQIVKATDTEAKKIYQYDGRGNLSKVMSSEQLLEQFVFNLANQMERAETFMGRAGKTGSIMLCFLAKTVYVNIEQELLGKQMKGSSCEGMYADEKWFICYGGSYVNVYHKK